MALLIIGVVLLIVAAVLLVIRRSQATRLHAILRTETSTARELADLAGAVRQEVGGPGFRHVAEVKGVLRCDSPLTSEIAQQPCAAYETSVVREYEETYWETDSQSGRREQKTRRSSNTVSSISRRTRFWVEDATGRVAVEPEGAKLDLTQVVDRFEPAGQIGPGGLSIGNFTLDLGGLAIASGSRTIGYRFREKVLPLDQRVYVLGEASDSSGELAIQRPSDGGKPFLVSVRSEEELVRSVRGNLRWLLVGAVASGAVGVALIVLQLLR